MAAPPASAGETAADDVARRTSLSRESLDLVKRTPVRYNPEGEGRGAALGAHAHAAAASAFGVPSAAPLGCAGPVAACRGRCARSVAPPAHKCQICALRAGGAAPCAGVAPCRSTVLTECGAAPQTCASSTWCRATTCPAPSWLASRKTWTCGTSGASGGAAAPAEPPGGTTEAARRLVLAQATHITPDLPRRRAGRSRARARARRPGMPPRGCCRACAGWCGTT